MGIPTTAATFLSATGPTGATPDTLALTIQIAINYTVLAGTYNDTITWVATPTY